MRQKLLASAALLCASVLCFGPAAAQMNTAPPSNIATSTNQASEIAALGAPADSAYGGSGTASIVAALKGIYAGLIAPTPAGTNAIGGVLGTSSFSVAFRNGFAANATVNGNARDAAAAGLASQSIYTRYGATVVADQAGTLYIQVSSDNVNWESVSVQTVAAGSRGDYAVSIRGRFYRSVWINGATASTALTILDSFTAN